MATVERHVSLDELRALFTGVPAEDNDWSTTPCYTVALALEIAKRSDSRTEHGLREELYDSTPPDNIPPRALQVISLATQRYRQQLEIQRTGRGL